jgi:hypothetical protein
MRERLEVIRDRVIQGYGLGPPGRRSRRLGPALVFVAPHSLSCADYASLAAAEGVQMETERDCP